MKSWKTVVVVVVVVSLVVTLAFVANYAFEDKALKATKQRIRQYRIVAEEQRLIRQILEDKIAVASIQSQFAPPPVRPVIQSVPDPDSPE